MSVFLLALANVLFPFAAIGYLIFFLLSPRRRLLKSLKGELAQRCGFVSREDKVKAANQKATWIHAASAGEVRSIVKMAPALRGNTPLIVTCSTSLGRDEAVKLLQPDVCVLAPLDFQPFAKRFVRALHPARLLVVETELWPNMFAAARWNGVTIGIINGRMSAKSRRGYAFVKPLFSMMMRYTDFACFQTEADAARYESLGLDRSRIIVTGNIKYDLLSDNPPRKAEAEKAVSALGWQKSKILVCGSTHPLEEKTIASAIAEFKKQGKPIKAAVAPRHLERMPAVMEIFTGQGLKTALYSKIDTPPVDADVLIIDTMGLLTSFYGSAYACFVGGTIENKGGHNLLEAAIFGKPVLIGPHTQNTPDVAAKLLELGGAITVSEDTFAAEAAKLAEQEETALSMGAKAREAADTFRGATERALSAVKKFL